MSNPTQILIHPKHDQFSFDLGGFLVGVLNGELGTAFEKTLRGKMTKMPNEGVAYSLISGGLLSACKRIYTSDDGVNRVTEEDGSLALKKEKLVASIEAIFTDNENPHYLKDGFFLNPMGASFLQPAKAALSTWFQKEFKFGKERSDVLSVPLSGYFLEEMAALWSGFRSDFEQIKSYFNNPFSEAFERKVAAEAYRAKLVSYYGKSPFGDDKIALKDIYVEPDFMVSSNHILDKPDQTRGIVDFVDSSYVGTLHQYVIDWISNEHNLGYTAEKSRFMLLLGQPGQGKSSFCARSMYDLLEKEQSKNVFFVRLKDFRDARELVKKPLETIRERIGKEYLPKSLDNRILKEDALGNSLLLLDGLDELYMQNGLSNADLEEFIRLLTRELRDFEGLKVIVTCRYNYLTVKYLPKEKVLILSLKPFSFQQQNKWLDKYEQFYPDCALCDPKKRATLRDINVSDDEKIADLKKLFDQPILLHLMAKSGFVPSNIKTNKAEIYKLLFDAVIERRKNDLEKYENVDEGDLREFLQVLAWEIFQSDHEYVRKSDFYEGKLKKAATKLRGKMGLGDDGKLDFLKELLVSFYFQNVPKSDNDRGEKDRDNYAIEFYHKSLYEYLAAEYAWTEMKGGFLAKNWKGDYSIDTPEDVIEFVWNLFHRKLLSVEVAGNYIQIVRNDVFNDKLLLFKRLRKFFPQLLKFDFFFNTGMPANNVLGKSMCTFYGYLVTLGSLVDRCMNVLDDDQNGDFVPVSERIKKWNFIPDDKYLFLRHFTIFKSYFGVYHPVILHYQKLSGTIIGTAYFHRISFRGSNLNRTVFTECIISQCDFYGVDLSYCSFQRTRAIGLFFSFTGLKHSTIKLCDFQSSWFEDCGLDKLRIISSDFTGANFVRTGLKDFEVRGSKFRGTTFRNIKAAEWKFEKVNLKYTYFENCTFEKSKFNFTNLKRTEFNSSSFDKTTCIGTCFNKHLADFTGTIYEGKFIEPDPETDDIV